MFQKNMILIGNKPEETESTHPPVPPTLQVALGSLLAALPVYSANCSHILPKVTALTAMSEEQVWNNSLIFCR